MFITIYTQQTKECNQSLWLFMGEATIGETPVQWNTVLQDECLVNPYYCMDDLKNAY